MEYKCTAMDLKQNVIFEISEYGVHPNITTAMFGVGRRQFPQYEFSIDGKTIFIYNDRDNLIRYIKAKEIKGS